MSTALPELAGHAERFRLESGPLDLGGGLRFGQAMDRFTQRSFGLWLAPDGLAGQIETLERRVAIAIGIGERRVLRTYGMHFEAGRPAVRVEDSSDVRLADAGPARELRMAKPAVTAGWLCRIAETLDWLQAGHGLAHGAVSPFWIRMSADGGPRLDGVAFAAPFADAGAAAPGSGWFASPERSSGAPPEQPDDVFGLCALAFWALAGGGSPDELRRAGAQPGAIDDLRRSRGLPPTGARSGWDEVLMAGLAPAASLRPASAAAIVKALQALHPTPANEVRPRESPRTRGRRLPPWRQNGNGARVPAAAPHDAPVSAERRASLQELERELAAGRQALEADTHANASQRLRLQADLAAVARTTAELDAARQKLEANEREVQQRQRELEAHDHALGQREQAVRTRDEAAAARESSFAARESALQSLEQQLAGREAELRQGREELEQSLRDSAESVAQFKRRQQELQAVEGELAARRQQLAAENESIAARRAALENDAEALRVEAERLRQLETDVGRREAAFTDREASLDARQAETARAQGELAAAREKLAAERAELDRAMLENASIVEEVRKAESMIEASRREAAAVETARAAQRTEAAAAEQAGRELELALQQREATLQEREATAGLQVKALEAIGIDLRQHGESGDVASVVEALGRKRAEIDAAAKKLADSEAGLEQGRLDLVQARQEQDRARAALVEQQKQLERERGEFAESAQRLARERESWDGDKRAQEKQIAARAAELEAANTQLRARLETAEKSPRGSPLARFWMAAALAGVAGALVLAFLYFQVSGDNAQLRRTAQEVKPQEPKTKTPEPKTQVATIPTVLVVVTDPVGAMVTAGNRPPQPSPAKFENLAAGPIEVLAKKDGYRDERKTIQLKAGETLLMEPIVLGPAAAAESGNGMLLVQTEPSGAEVSIVGSSAAPQRSPAVFRNLPEGTVAVSLRLAGYQVERRDVAVRSNKASVVEHVFRRAETPVVVGALSVTTVPEDAEVEIGGRPVIRISGRPAAMPNLPPGPVKVIVRQDGFDPVEQTFQIKPGVTETPTITLRKTPPPQPKVTPITLTLPADFTVQAARGIQLVRIAAREVAVPGESGRFKITRPFMIGTTEVTQAQYQALTGRNPSTRFEKRTKGESRTVKRPPRFEMRGGTQVPIPQPDEVIPGEETVVTYATHPVENVTWAEAMEFCRLLTEREKGRLPAGTVFRLPTEAEWWLAADSGLESKNAGWFAGTAQGEHRDVPASPPTERSIHDLQGNVAEWCIDAWSDKPPVAGASDPVTLDPALRALLRGSFETYSVRDVADTQGRRLAIGGSFRDPGARVSRKPADARAPDIGFRIVLGYPVGGVRNE